MKKWQDIFEPEFKLGFGAQIGVRLKDREEFRKIIDFVGKSMFGDVVFVGNFRILKTEIIDCLNGEDIAVCNTEQDADGFIQYYKSYCRPSDKAVFTIRNQALLEMK